MTFQTETLTRVEVAARVGPQPQIGVEAEFFGNIYDLYRAETAGVIRHRGRPGTFVGASWNGTEDGLRVKS